jgi:hypothetical protein
MAENRSGAKENPDGRIGAGKERAWMNKVECRLFYETDIADD